MSDSHMSDQLSHQDFMRHLSNAEKRELTAKSNTSATIRLATVVCLLCIFSTVILNQQLPYWSLFLLPQGLLIVSLFHLLHECIHDTPFRNRNLNPLIASICGFILLLPSEWFRYFHRDHHRYTQIEGKDPELESAKPATKIQWLIHITGIPVFISLVKVIFRCASGTTDDSFIPTSARKKVITQARIMSFLYAALFIICAVLQNTSLLWIWTIPLITGQPFLRLYLLAEHTLCDKTDDMFLNTRTVLTNPAVRWFTWNMPYHTEHHVFPAVPFDKLPALHRKMNRYLKHKNRSYSQFNRQLYTTLR